MSARLFVGLLLVAVVACGGALQPSAGDAMLQLNQAKLDSLSVKTAANTASQPDTLHTQMSVSYLVFAGVATGVCVFGCLFGLIICNLPCCKSRGEESSSFMPVKGGKRKGGPDLSVYDHL
mmetsp:Transcript_10810/g.15600  ORF Transcript_10810/g.15600 Transcript_10810/m.15600 type:complete len:121 (-) Transcript_10810:400-762(-)